MRFQQSGRILLLLLVVLLLPGCDAIGMIFEAGIWVGIVGIALVVGIVWFLMKKFGR